jgi:hypothetical protein
MKHFTARNLADLFNSSCIEKKPPVPAKIVHATKKSDMSALEAFQETLGD